MAPMQTSGRSTGGQLPNHGLVTKTARPKAGRTLRGGKKRESHRFETVAAALRETREYRKTGELSIPKLSFTKVVREVIQNIPNKHHDEMRVQLGALNALQEAAEFYIVKHLRAAYLCAVHDKRVTLMVRDMRLVKDYEKILGLA